MKRTTTLTAISKRTTMMVSKYGKREVTVFVSGTPAGIMSFAKKYNIDPWNVPKTPIPYLKLTYQKPEIAMRDLLLWWNKNCMNATADDTREQIKYIEFRSSINRAFKLIAS